MNSKAQMQPEQEPNQPSPKLHPVQFNRAFLSGILDKIEAKLDAKDSQQSQPKKQG